MSNEYSNYELYKMRYKYHELYAAIENYNITDLKAILKDLSSTRTSNNILYTPKTTNSRL